MIEYMYMYMSNIMELTCSHSSSCVHVLSTVHVHDVCMSGLDCLVATTQNHSVDGCFSFCLFSLFHSYGECVSVYRDMRRKP